MGTLGSVFDIIIVGALALPWVLLIIHLFFSDHESSLKKLLAWVKDQNQPTLVSVLLFAMAYPIGTAVSRIAQDFFDDSDLHFHIHAFTYERWYRLPMATETSIRSDVYCDVQTQIQKLTPIGKGVPPAPSVPDLSLCKDAEARLTLKTRNGWDTKQNLEDLAERVFRFQEAALLLQGTDNTEKPRQFHDQIVVLRGAAFDGMIVFCLCLFWWSAGFHSRLRWAAPLALSLLGINATCNHVLERAASDPPYMEFTLLVLAAAGWYVLWPRDPKPKVAPDKAATQNGRGQIRFAYLTLTAFLAASAFLGWWSTQVLYDQQVFYSYQAMIQHPKAAPASK